MISKYDNPALQPVKDLTPTTAELPFEALYNQLQQKQAAHDKGKALVKQTKDGLYAVANSLQVDDPTRQEILNNYSKRIESTVAAAKGDYSVIQEPMDLITSEIVRDVTGGMLGKMQSSLASAQADAETYAKEADKIGTTNKIYGDREYEVFASSGGTVLLNNGSYSTYNGASYKNDVSNESLKQHDDAFKNWMASSEVTQTSDGVWMHKKSNKQVTAEELLPNVQNIVYSDAEFQQQVKRNAVVANKTYHTNKAIIERADYVLDNGVLTETQRAEIVKNKGIAEAELNLYTRSNKNNLIMEMNSGIEANKKAITSRLSKLSTASKEEKAKLNNEIATLNTQIKAFADTINNSDSLTADDFANAADSAFIENSNNARVKFLVDKYSFSETENLKDADPYYLIASRAKANEEQPVNDRIIEVNLSLDLNNKVTVSDLEKNKNDLTTRHSNIKSADHINKVFYTGTAPSDRRDEVVEAISNLGTSGGKERLNALYDELSDPKYQSDRQAMAAAVAYNDQTTELAYTVEQQKTLFKQYVATPEWKSSVIDYMSGINNNNATGFSKVNEILLDGEVRSLSTQMQEYLLEGLSPDEAMKRLESETALKRTAGAAGGGSTSGDRNTAPVFADTIEQEYTKVFNSLISNVKPLVNDSQIITFHSDNINNALKTSQGGLASQATLHTAEGKDISMKGKKIVDQYLTGGMDAEGNYLYAVKVQEGGGDKPVVKTYIVKNSIENADSLFSGIGAASAMLNRKTVAENMGGFNKNDLLRLDGVIEGTGDKAAYQLIGQRWFKQALTSNGFPLPTPNGETHLIRAKTTTGNSKSYALYDGEKLIIDGLNGPQFARILGIYMYDHTTVSLKGNASTQPGKNIYPW